MIRVSLERMVENRNSHSDSGDDLHIVEMS